MRIGQDAAIFTQVPRTQEERTKLLELRFNAVVVQKLSEIQNARLPIKENLEVPFGMLSFELVSERENMVRKERFRHLFELLQFEAKRKIINIACELEEPFRKWLVEKKYKYRYICASSHTLLQRPFKIFAQSLLFSKGLRPEDRELLQALRVNGSTLVGMRIHEYTSLSIFSYEIPLTDFVEVDEVEVTSLRKRISEIFKRFQFSQVELDFDSYATREKLLDPAFASWLWRRLSLEERKKYFCPWSGNPLVEPVQDKTKKVTIDRKGARDLNHDDIFDGRAISVNGIDLSELIDVRLSSDESRDCLLTYREFWVEFVNAEPEEEIMSSLARRQYKVPRTIFQDKYFLHWLWEHLNANERKNTSALYRIAYYCIR